MNSRILLSRRVFVVGGACVLAAPGLQAQGQSPTPPATAAIAAIESRIGGRIGVAAVDTGSGAQLSYRGDERFAMCSTFKWVLAAAVLEKIDCKDLALSDRISFTASDLLAHAPVVRANLSTGALTIEHLCAAIVEVSDNSAANLLLPLVGDPPGLTQFIRRAGDQVTRLDRTEPALNDVPPGDPRDTTAPDAMVFLMRAVLLGDVLSAGMRGKLIGWMKNSKTGLQRLRAGLPLDWIVGDKTGSGPGGKLNDVAIAWLPARAPLLIAAYFDGSNEPAAVINAAHAEIARIVATAFTPR